MKVDEKAKLLLNGEVIEAKVLSRITSLESQSLATYSTKWAGTKDQNLVELEVSDFLDFDFYDNNKKYYIIEVE